ncbi:MAG: hypothetical protein H0U74_04025 [Bradymonadaceae bacterium]|nr:hypothetical protein [Lujinxingiaceae bacterium]
MHKTTPNDNDHAPDFRPWWQSPAGIAVIVLGFLGVSITMCCLSPVSYLRGTTDIFGNYRFIQERQLARESQVGLELVHAQLFPHWLIAVSRGQEADHARRDELFEAITGAVEDGELLDILEQMREILDAGDIGIEFEEFERLMRAWNRRVEALGEPFMIEGSLVRSRDRVIWVSEFYRQLANAPVLVGDLEVRVRIVERVDTTNIYESYLGVAKSGAEEALVVVDRILDFAVSTLWPLFEERDEAPEDPVDAAFGEAIRAEAKAALSPAQFKSLTIAASGRRELREAVQSVHARHSCGSTFRFNDIPWDGFNTRDIGLSGKPRLGHKPGHDALSGVLGRQARRRPPRAGDSHDDSPARAPLRRGAKRHA